MRLHKSPISIDENYVLKLDGCKLTFGSLLKIPRYAWRNWGIPFDSDGRDPGTLFEISEQEYAREWRFQKAEAYDDIARAAKNAKLGDANAELNKLVSEKVTAAIKKTTGDITMVDVGAGTALTSVAILKKLPKRDRDRIKKLFLIEPSKQAIGKGEENLESILAQDRGTILLERDVIALNKVIPANSVDLVYANASIHHHSDMLPVLEGIYRVLKPTGQLYIGDWHNSLCVHPRYFCELLKHDDIWDDVAKKNSAIEEITRIGELNDPTCPAFSDLDSIDQKAFHSIIEFWRKYATLEHRKDKVVEFEVLEGHRPPENYARDLESVGFEVESPHSTVDPESKLLCLTCAAKHVRSGLTKAVSQTPMVHRIVGSSADLVALSDIIRKSARVDSSVLITGETGVGKELVAKAIHALSSRRDEHFAAVNCAALTEALLESEMFGHVRGAFTGANAHKVGMFEHASDGTLFLDELGSMPPSIQGKLLRALQEKKIRPVGGNKEIAVNTRVIAATNEDLKDLVATKRFREDLFYRINVIHIDVKPLRKRVEDIRPLALHLINDIATDTRGPLYLSDDACDLLEEMPWPGNVRQLGNTLEQIIFLHLKPGETVIDRHHLVDAMDAKVNSSRITLIDGLLPRKLAGLRPAAFDCARYIALLFCYLLEKDPAQLSRGISKKGIRTRMEGLDFSQTLEACRISLPSDTAIWFERKKSGVDVFRAAQNKLTQHAVGIVLKSTPPGKQSTYHAGPWLKGQVDSCT